MEHKAPDILLLAAHWPERALLRAQLIEDGYDVVAIDVSPIPMLYRRPGMAPGAMLIDLNGLAHPRETLESVRAVLPPDRILVITALSTLTAAEVRRLGFSTIERPATIGQIVVRAASLLTSARANTDIARRESAPSGREYRETHHAANFSMRRTNHLEAEMRKQDRIRQQQSRPEEQAKPQPQPRDEEQATGSASADQPAKPPRQSGKLPLPD